MVVVRFRARLGNQLFQYATAWTVAARSRSSLFFDTHLFTSHSDRRLEINQFQIRGRVLPAWMQRAVSEPSGGRLHSRLLNRVGRAMVLMIIDKQAGYDPAIDQLRGPCNLLGFWQSEKYFTASRSMLLRELVPVRPLTGEVGRLISEMTDCDSIAVHVRRGDLLTDPVCVNTVGTLPRQYYEQAISRLVADSRNARIYVFTDDIEWAEANILSLRPVTIVSDRITKTAVEDLTAMSHCRNFVIANSTFSWWGAWLGNSQDKRVVAPARFFKTFRAWEHDLVPHGWERIGVQM